ncbi:NAD(P)-dependent oxidoreductase [Planomonospora parontospora]|uniref:NAD(P)-dependent oxidoreductase n=1 Tax=Planomonospora parontospora TaxID=58119 RepID=UPI001670849D|nr:NAD(P)-binding domain-containing protein [Planomonospora parontospora]GGL54911.1 oxidoreductase [Planomonospora parontospora subsp. antibiotica]GII19288.1 oxidoreductase [Planomonospora parontospora subsp. antibiotica]
MTGIATVGVLGGGIMARAIIPHLRAGGYALRLYNRTLQRLDAFAGDGVELCASAAQAAHGADAVVSFVSDDEASAAVWFGARGALASLSAGARAVECSTLSSPYMRRWITACRHAGVRPVDVALTGGLERAQQGTLIGFAGGAPEDLHALEAVLSTYTETVIRFGDSGAGMRYKLVHNLAAAAALVGLAEALTLAERSELSMPQVVQTLSAYGWAAPVACSKAANMTGDRHEPVTCSLDNLAKDVGYALASAPGAADLAVARAVRAQMDRALANGASGRDMGAVKRAYGTSGRAEPASKGGPV